MDVSENLLVSCDRGLGRVLGKMIAWESGNGGLRNMGSRNQSRRMEGSSQKEEKERKKVGGQ